MSQVRKPCRVCGKSYIPCNTCEKDQSAFHWREVACSVECGMKYLAEIEKSRKADIKPIEKKSKKAKVEAKKDLDEDE